MGRPDPAVRPPAELFLLVLLRPVAFRLLVLLLLNFLLLALLQFLRLFSVLLLQLLQLLLLAALHLFLLSLIHPLPFQFLLLLDVSLLHLLALHILLLAQLFYFSLLLLLQPGIDARGVRGARGGRTVFEDAPVVIRRRIARTIRFPRVFDRAIRVSGSATFHRAAAAELARPRSGGNVWTTTIHGSQQRPVGAGG